MRKVVRHLFHTKLSVPVYDLFADQMCIRDSTGYAHIAFSVGSKEKVDALTAQLKSDGYEIVSGPRTTGDGYYESCIVAIEGNQIEITV